MHDFSLIIPTRNRHNCLIKTVQAIFNAINGIEIIITDNSDQKLQYEFLTRDSVLKYIYIPEFLSVVDNFEKGLKHSTRKYVAMIGDDDLVSGNLPAILKIMTENKIDSIYPWNDGYIAHFIWPGIIEESGQLWLRDYDWTLSLHSTSKSISDALKYPGKGPSNLPKIYQGIVSQDIIRKTRKKYGHIFGGVSPDIYSGIMLANNSRTVTSINYPFIIPGASKSSTAGEGVLRSDREKSKSNKEHIARFGKSLNWPNFIPNVYTPHTVWALSLYSAAKQLGCDDKQKYIFFLYCEMLARYPRYWREIFKSINNNSCMPFPYKFYYGIESVLSYYFPRMLNKFNHKNIARKIIFNDISEIQTHVS